LLLVVVAVVVLVVGAVFVVKFGVVPLLDRKDTVGTASRGRVDDGVVKERVPVPTPAASYGD
jgi:hypothetical protein